MTDLLWAVGKYAEYKRTKINWAPEIPSHWEVKALKYVAKLQSGDTIRPEQFTTEGYPVYGGNGFRGYTHTFNSVGRLPLVGRQGALCGNVNYSEGKFFASEHAVVVRPKTEASVTWLGESIRVADFNRLSQSTAQPGISVGVVENELFPVPPLTEQQAISGFVEQKSRKIDKAVRAKEQQITLLKERKQILIQNAVTRGLNPDAPMRDSGEEWIGEIPEHWQLHRVKRVFRLAMEVSGKRHDHELLSIYTDIGVRPRKDLKEKGNKASTTDDYWLVRKGDFIVNKLLAWMGAIGISEYEGVTSPAYDILRPVVDIDGQFYHYLFRTKLCTAELKKRSRGIMEMRLRLYFDRFGSLRVPLPPKSEQTEIVDFIGAETEKVDKVMDLLDHQIAKLKEYKVTLINSAVTGKIKVSGGVEPKQKEEALI